MGLQSALTTALTGLQASETTINIIGNNVANSNTVGFKSSEVVFATQFLQTQSIGSAPSATNGGTNPRQIGLGVRVSQISPNFNQGTVEISSNQLDVAIQGDGFLVVQGTQGEPLYTRNGQLSLNSLNQVVTSTGNLVLGFGVNDTFDLQTSTTQPLTIPLGSQRVAQQTETAILEGVLNPTVDIATQPSISESQILGNDSVEFPDSAGVSVASFDAPPAGTAVENTTTAGGLTAGTEYRYRVTFLDANGEETSPSSEFSVTPATGTSVDITLPAAPGVFTQYNIYRTEGAGPGGTFSLVNPAPIAVSGTPPTVFTDDVAPGALGAAAPTSIDGGTYDYYFTYFDPSNPDSESRPSLIVNGASRDDSDGSIRLDLGSIPQPSAASGFSQLRIYRNQSGSLDDFFLLDNVATASLAPGASYIDNTPSSALDGREALDFDGPRANPGTLLVNLQTRSGATYNSPFSLGAASGGTLRFTGERAGSDLDTLELRIDGTTTVTDFTDFVFDALGLQQSSAAPQFPLGGDQVPTPPQANVEITTDGILRVTSNLGEQNAIEIPLTAFTLQPDGSDIQQSVSIAFSETQQANGPGTTTEFLVFDSLGSPLSIRLTTVLEDSSSDTTTYRWFATSGDSNPTPPDLSTVVGNGVLRFDTNGDLIPPFTGQIAIQRELTASGSPLPIDLDFSAVTALADTDANGAPISSLNLTSQDGFPPGVLTDFVITESGEIQGQFSNGTQRTLGQLVMARFANNQGLSQVGNSLYTASVNSGAAIIGNPGQDGLGTITSGAVELSNTDIGQDLVEMILAQTQYQAGSRVITAAQELLDELLALQR